MFTDRSDGGGTRGEFFFDLCAEIPDCLAWKPEIR
jgi:hypothetical protein